MLACQSGRTFGIEAQAIQDAPRLVANLYLSRPPDDHQHVERSTSVGNAEPMVLDGEVADKAAGEPCRTNGRSSVKLLGASVGELIDWSDG